MVEKKLPMQARSNNKKGEEGNERPAKKEREDERTGAGW